MATSIEENLKQNKMDVAYSYAQSSVGFDPNSSKLISEKAFEIAKTLTSNPQNSNNLIALCDFSTSFNNNLQNEWSLLLKSFLDKNGNSIDKNALANICVKTSQWNPSLKDEMSNLVFQKGKEELLKNELDENTLQSLMNAATSINEGLKPEASALIWEKLSTNFTDLKKLGKSRFLSLFNLCENYGLSSDVSNSDNYQFASALKNYEDGDKEAAISIFKSLSGKKNSIAGKASSQIISPPQIGNLSFNSTPFSFKGTWSYFGGSGLDITLTSIKIKSSSITVIFSMKNNGNNKECLIYSTKTLTERFGSNCEKLYILDNNGKKSYSYGGFVGGKHENYNSCCNKICFNPNEEIILSADFPMISPGATSIKFVSPNPDNAGHQSEWSWDNLKLKNEPFE